MDCDKKENKKYDKNKKIKNNSNNMVENVRNEETSKKN